MESSRRESRKREREEEAASGPPEKKGKEQKENFAVAKSHIEELLKTADAIKKYAPLGLARKKQRDSKVAYVPRAGARQQGITLDKDGNEIKRFSAFPLKFIPVDKDTEQAEGQGAKKPSAVRMSLFESDELEELILKLNEGSDPDAVLCASEGKFTSARSVDMEHFKSNKKFMDAQADLVSHINADKRLREKVLRLDGAEDFFIRVNEGGSEKYYGTLYFYELGYNNICNLWLMCHACNTSKSSKELLGWLKESPFYGPAFIEYAKKEGALEDVSLDKMLSLKVGPLRDLAQGWLLSNNKEFIGTLKKVEEFSAEMRSAAEKVKESGDEAEAEQIATSVKAGVEVGEVGFETAKEIVASQLAQGTTTSKKVAEALPAVKEGLAADIVEALTSKAPTEKPGSTL